MGKTIVASIEGMTCGHCAKAIEKELKKVAGIESLRVETGSATVLVSEDTQEIRRAIENAVSEAGYKVSGFGAAEAHKGHQGKCCC